MRHGEAAPKVHGRSDVDGLALLPQPRHHLPPVPRLSRCVPGAGGLRVGRWGGRAPACPISTG